MRNNDDNEIEIISNRLYYTIQSNPTDSPSIHYFSTDDNEEFFYQPFFNDFGPLSLLQIHKFYLMVEKMLRTQKKVIYYYSCSKIESISNSTLLIGSFLLIYSKLNIPEIIRITDPIMKKSRPFRDASPLPVTFELDIPTCLGALQKAMDLKWYIPILFSSDDWQHFEKVENGDMNWIIPEKLLAFASPYQERIFQGCWKVATPKEITPFFKVHNINHVIRLNSKTYDETPFIQAGIKFTELIFTDGSNPPFSILHSFLRIMDTQDVVALHCKAGLGRTGTLAACFLAQNFGFTGPEAIAWVRICRPGSVIGQQQHFVVEYANSLKNNKLTKKSSTLRKSLPPNLLPKIDNIRQFTKLNKNSKDYQNKPISSHPQPRKLQRLPIPKSSLKDFV